MPIPREMGVAEGGSAKAAAWCVRGIAVFASANNGITSSALIGAHMLHIYTIHS